MSEDLSFKPDELPQDRSLVLVDDDRAFVLRLAKAMEGRGFEVRTAHSVAEGLALIHAQFEIIHPFRDGNGRIGRMLVPLFLYEKKLLSRPTFYLSQYLDEHRAEYIARLRALDGAPSWNEWTVFFLRALAAQAEANADKARHILAL